MFSSLRYFNFRLWFAGAFVSNVGAWMQRVAQDWLVLTVLTEDSGVAVGIVTGLQFLPYLFLSPWAGVLADRLDHRPPSRRDAELGQAALALGLGGLVLGGHAQLWHVYVFAFLLGCVTAIDGPVRQSFVSDLVPTDRLPNAVALNSVSFHSARLVGPAAAGLAILWLGIGWIFIVNGLTYFAAIAALWAMRPADLAPSARVKRGKGQIRAGMRYVRGRSDILVILVVVGVVSMFGPQLPDDHRAHGATRVRSWPGRVRSARIHHRDRVARGLPARRPAQTGASPPRLVVGGLRVRSLRRPPRRDADIRLCAVAARPYRASPPSR